MLIAMYVIWSVIAGIAIIVEISTQIQFGWAMSIAAVGALITHAIRPNKPVWIEIVVFLIIWSVLWLLLFMFRKRIFHRLHDKDDGFWSYVGKTFIATKGNKSGYGQIKINDKVFRFKSEDIIKANDKIVVNKIKGVTFIVIKKERG